MASFKSLERPDSPSEELLARDWGAEQLQDLNVVSKAYLKERSSLSWGYVSGLVHSSFRPHRESGRACLCMK